MAKRAIEEACPIEDFLDLIGNKWFTLIVRELLKKSPLRFGHLKRTLPGVSSKTLTEKLRHLEKNGLVRRRVYPEIPPRVEYKLTKKGKSLEPVLEHMKNWYETWGRVE